MTGKEKAVEIVLKHLLYRRFLDVSTNQISAPLIDQHSSIEEILNKSIYLGGSFSIDCGDYWAADYSPGIKIKLLKRENAEIVYEQISRSKIFEVANKLIAEYKKESVQLELFQ